MEVTSNITADRLPGRGAVGYLDAEIAGEGQKIILGNGDEVAWAPPPEQLTIPDWSKVKAIRHYFGRRAHQVFPAWFYHPTEKPRLMKTAEHARAELGVFYRKATADERGRYGLEAVWDWDEGSSWRPQPWNEPKFDPASPGQGKTYVPSAPNQTAAQHQLVQALIPQVAAAVAQALRSSGPAAPANVDPKDWSEFLEFQAWKKTQETVDQAAAEAAAPEGGNALNRLSAHDERSMWEEEAAAHGVAVDPAWTLERLKAEVEKAAKAA